MQEQSRTPTQCPLPDLALRLSRIEEQLRQQGRLNNLLKQQPGSRCPDGGFEHLSDCILEAKRLHLINEEEFRELEKVNRLANQAKHCGVGDDGFLLKMADAEAEADRGCAAVQEDFFLGDMISALQRLYSKALGRSLRKNEPRYSQAHSRPGGHGTFQMVVHLDALSKEDFVGDEYRRKQLAKHSAALQAVLYLQSRGERRMATAISQEELKAEEPKVVTSCDEPLTDCGKAPPIDWPRAGPSSCQAPSTELLQQSPCVGDTGRSDLQKAQTDQLQDSPSVADGGRCDLHSVPPMTGLQDGPHSAARRSNLHKAPPMNGRAADARPGEVQGLRHDNEAAHPGEVQGLRRDEDAHRSDLRAAPLLRPQGASLGQLEGLRAEAPTLLEPGQVWTRLELREEAGRQPAAGEEQVLELLKKSNVAVKTLTIAKELGKMTCREVNPLLYKLKLEGKIYQVEGAKPLWRLGPS